MPGKLVLWSLGRHGLHLGAVEHTHNRGLDDIVEVVPQCDLVAAQLLGLAVEVAAPHPGAEIAGVLVGVVGHREDVALEDGHRDVEQLGVGLDLLAVYLIVAGVHHQKDQLKGGIAVLCSSCMSFAISIESLPPEMQTAILSRL